MNDVLFSATLSYWLYRCAILADRIPWSNESLARQWQSGAGAFFAWFSTGPELGLRMKITLAMDP